MADEFEQTHLPLLLLPDGGTERRTQGKGEHDKQHAPIEITQCAVLRGAREGGEMQATFPSLEYKLSGEGLAQCLDWYPARFQPLPIGTAREVFPQAAPPTGFTTRVMGQGDTGSDFHWYAAAPWSGLSFQSQNSPRAP